MQEVIFLGQFVLAVILGGLLGWQREHAGKVAGPRTYGLVAAGACLFTILSLTSFPGDVARVASGVVTGIGFLGAGMIIRQDSKHISGLTTAAGLWMSAAIGMAVATEYYLLAIFSTIVIFLVLTVDDDRLNKKK